MSREWIAVCLVDGAPLISTILFPKKEWVCVECGRLYEFFGPRTATPTPELTARYDRLEAEWEEHARPKLRVIRGWFDDCEKCAERGEYHEAHATDEERAQHEGALAWLRERRPVGEAG